MARILTGLALVLAALGALILALPEPDRSAVRQTGAGLAISNVMVFDGEAFHAGQTLLIQDGLIAASGADLAVPAGAEVIDGTGLTALPGLIDAHTHTWGEGLETALAFGVTTHLDMFSSPLMLPQARRNRDDLSLHDQADLFSSGMLATVEGGHGTQYGLPMDTLSGPEQAPA